MLFSCSFDEHLGVGSRFARAN